MCNRFISIQAEELDLECKVLIVEFVVYRSDSEPRDVHWKQKHCSRSKQQTVNVIHEQ